MKPDVKPELKELIANIATKNMYYGNKVPQSIIKKFEIEETDFNTGILVPFWLAVLQYGRGKRKSNKSSSLWKKIYAWMEKRNMFKASDRINRIREAKYLTWYINKHGNKQFREKKFIDIYKTERERTIKKINDKFSKEINKITMDVI